MRLLALVCLLLVATAAPAAASSHLLIGVTEDGLKFEPDATRRDATALGLDAVRITLAWRPGRTDLTPDERAELDRATAGAGPLRVVLSVFGERAVGAPQTAVARGQYCTFLRQIVARYPRIRDVVVWNEPNKTVFWQPQFDAQGRSVAPAAYEALLARCWDVLHAQRPDVNVLAPSLAPRGNDDPEASASTVSHSPVRFLEGLGRAYRASGRDHPIFDTVAHHVHGSSPGERPWRQHPGRSVSEGDYGRLLATLRRAFGGTAQPVPGHCVAGRCVAVWYVEAGFETTPDRSKAHLYTGHEITETISAAAGPVDLSPLPPADSDAPDQASQLVGAIELAYCQLYVEGFFNFLLWDEARLEGWQSGLYWADRTEKDSAASFREVVRAARGRRIFCPRLRRELTEPTAVLGPPASAAQPTGTTTSTTTRSTPAPGGSAPEGDDGGLDARVIAPGAAVLILVGGALIAAARRRSRSRRNSR